MRYEIEEEVRNGILKYLATKPYNEVAQGIQALQKLKPIEEEIKVKK